MSKAYLDRILTSPIAFIDSESNFYSIFPDGSTDFFTDVKLVGNVVLHLGEPEDLNYPELSRAIDGEYCAWDSMEELKAACNK